MAPLAEERAWALLGGYFDVHCGQIFGGPTWYRYVWAKDPHGDVWLVTRWCMARFTGKSWRMSQWLYEDWCSGPADRYEPEADTVLAKALMVQHGQVREPYAYGPTKISFPVRPD